MGAFSTDVYEFETEAAVDTALLVREEVEGDTVVTALGEGAKVGGAVVKVTVFLFSLLWFLQSESDFSLVVGETT